MRTSLVAAVAAVALGASGCPSPPPQGVQYPPRQPGCEVQVFHDAPSIPTDNIGPVMATCGEDIKDEDCLRTLKDEACKLGGDVVWGVADVPASSQGKKKLAGRTAHSKTAGK